MKKMSKWSVIMMTGALAGCASDQGTHPHDMSAAQHVAAASQEETAAEGHQGQFDAGAEQQSTVCGQATTVRPATQDGPPCWTSRSNPTAQHTQDAARHRELAAKHRAASAALVEAERQSCASIDEDDRDTSPFYHREDIVSVGPVEISGPYNSKNPPSDVAGARIALRAVPGLTVEWLQHLVNCHIARASAVGHDMPEMSYCPLVLKGVRAQVRSAGDTFEVEVISDDSATAHEILRRAQALRSGAPTGATSER